MSGGFRGGAHSMRRSNNYRDPPLVKLVEEVRYHVVQFLKSCCGIDITNHNQY